MAIVRSFSIRSRPKPLSNLRDSTNCLNFFCEELFIPVEALITSTIRAGSRPKRWPMSRASMPIRKPPALTRLLSAFMAWAEPTSPVRVMVLPIADSTGRIRSMMSSGPPTMIASCPVRARETPPETGASINTPPSSATRAASALVSAGTPEVMSITTVPGRRVLPMLSSTSPTAALVGSMVTMMSEAAARACIVSGAAPPTDWANFSAWMRR